MDKKRPIDEMSVDELKIEKSRLKKYLNDLRDLKWETKEQIEKVKDEIMEKDTSKCSRKVEKIMNNFLYSCDRDEKMFCESLDAVKISRGIKRIYEEKVDFDRCGYHGGDRIGYRFLYDCSYSSHGEICPFCRSAEKSIDHTIADILITQYLEQYFAQVRFPHHVVTMILQYAGTTLYEKIIDILKKLKLSKDVIGIIMKYVQTDEHEFYMECDTQNGFDDYEAYPSIKIIEEIPSLKSFGEKNYIELVRGEPVHILSYLWFWSK
jgi:hypothetical protein